MFATTTTNTNSASAFYYHSLKIKSSRLEDPIEYSGCGVCNTAAKKPNTCLSDSLIRGNLPYILRFLSKNT